jgi:hypothetical protein
MVEIISAIIGALGTIAVTLIKEKIQNRKSESPSGLLVPNSYVYQKTQNTNHWFILITTAIVGGIIGYSIGYIFSGQHINSAFPKPTLVTALSPSTCPYVSPYSKAINNKYVYILIDNSGSYMELQQDSLKILSEALPKAISVDDHILLSWINLPYGSPSRIFFDQGVELILPTAISTPEYIPTLTPIAGSSPQLTKQMATRTAQDVLDQNKEAENDYYCQLSQQNNQIEVSNNERLSLLNANLKTAIENTRTYTSYQGTTTNIWQALYVASKTLEDVNLRNEYESIKLIIFSDLASTGEETHLQLDFNGVDIIVAMLPCYKAQDCQTTISNWTKYFEQANSKSTNFELVEQLNRETLEYLILAP